MDSGRLQPALLAGVFIGVLSGLPFVQMGNCCCCLWVIGGGALAVYLRQQNTPVPVNAAEGALMGLMAGAIGGVIGAVLSAFTGPLQMNSMVALMERMGDVPPELRDAVEKAKAGGAMGAGLFASVIIGLFINAIFGMLGGLLGVAIFKKNVPPAPPTPPTIIPHDPDVAH